MIFQVVISSIGTFLTVLLLFIFVWRLYKPKQEIRTLLIMFIALPSIFFGIKVVFGNQGNGSMLPFFAMAELYYALAFMFIQVYPGIKNEIPSFKILLLLDNNKETGLKKSDFIHLMSTRDLVLDRIFDLENDSLVIMKNGNLHLSISGKFLVTIFKAYRRLLGLKTGLG